MFNFFTPVKANRILPEVKVKFANILMQRNSIMDLQAELKFSGKSRSVTRVIFHKEKSS